MSIISCSPVWGEWHLRQLICSRGRATLLDWLHHNHTESSKPMDDSFALQNMLYSYLFAAGLVAPLFVFTI